MAKKKKRRKVKRSRKKTRRVKKSRKKTRRVKKSRKKTRRIKKSRKKARKVKKSKRTKAVKRRQSFKAPTQSKDSEGNTLIKVSDSWAHHAYVNESKYKKKYKLSIK